VIAERLGGRVAAFGDYVRYLAAAAGEGSDRASLQQVGQRKVEAGSTEFVREFLSWAAPVHDMPLVIDGVRHAVVDQLLRTWASELNRDYILVVLQTDLQARAERRSGGDAEALRRMDEHPVEREAWETLPALADIVVDGTGGAEQVIERIAAAAPDLLNGLL
jgi:hypothetical protein